MKAQNLFFIIILIIIVGFGLYGCTLIYNGGNYVEKQKEENKEEVLEVGKTENTEIIDNLEIIEEEENEPNPDS